MFFILNALLVSIKFKHIRCILFTPVFSVAPGTVALLFEHPQPSLREELVVVAQSPHDVLLLEGVVESVLGLSEWEDALEEDDEALRLDGPRDARQHVQVVCPTQIAEAPNAEDAVVALYLHVPSEVPHILLVDNAWLAAEALDRLGHRLVPLEHLHLREIGQQNAHVPATAGHQLEDGPTSLEPAVLHDRLEIFSHSQMKRLVNCGEGEWFVLGVVVELILVVLPVHLVVWLELEISCERCLAILLYCFFSYLNDLNRFGNFFWPFWHFLQTLFIKHLLCFFSSCLNIECHHAVLSGDDLGRLTPRVLGMGSFDLGSSLAHLHAIGLQHGVIFWGQEPIIQLW
jgi:hypothetical protein